MLFCRTLFGHLISQPWILVLIGTKGRHYKLLFLSHLCLVTTYYMYPEHTPEVEARYSTKRDTQWVGYKTHLSETCDDGYPDLITQALTTPATTPDCVMGPVIQKDLAQRALLPGTHLLDSGYVDAEFLASAQHLHHIDVIGPPFGSYSRQHRAGQGYGVEAFTLAWAAQQARCPQGHPSVKWTPGHDMRGGRSCVFVLTPRRVVPVRSAVPAPGPKRRRAN